MKFHAALIVDMRRMVRGFSLMELMMVLAVSGLMLGFILQTTRSGTANKDCYASTSAQIQTIRGAVERFARNNNRLPIPAARNVGVSNINFGREASLPADIDQDSGISYGAVPFQSLGLSPAYAGDCWGNKFTYVVTTALTTNDPVTGFLNSAIVGNIEIKSSVSTTTDTTTAYAIISHGEDALGAVTLNYESAGHGWCSGAASLKTMNCRVSDGELASTILNLGADAGASYFDDIIVTSGRPIIL